MFVAFCSFCTSCWLLSAHLARHVGCFLPMFHVMLVACCSFSTSCWLLSAHLARHVGCFLLIFHVMLVALGMVNKNCAKRRLKAWSNMIAMTAK
jgi:hypothetical protein